MKQQEQWLQAGRPESESQQMGVSFHLPELQCPHLGTGNKNTHFSVL